MAEFWALPNVDLVSGITILALVIASFWFYRRVSNNGNRDTSEELEPEETQCQEESIVQDQHVSTSAEQQTTSAELEDKHVSTNEPEDAHEDGVIDLNTTHNVYLNETITGKKKHLENILSNVLEKLTDSLQSSAKGKDFSNVSDHLYICAVTFMQNIHLGSSEYQQIKNLWDRMQEQVKNVFRLQTNKTHKSTDIDDDVTKAKEKVVNLVEDVISSNSQADSRQSESYANYLAKKNILGKDASSKVIASHLSSVIIIGTEKLFLTLRSSVKSLASNREVLQKMFNEITKVAAFQKLSPGVLLDQMSSFPFTTDVVQTMLKLHCLDAKAVTDANSGRSSCANDELTEIALFVILVTLIEKFIFEVPQREDDIPEITTKNDEWSLIVKVISRKPAEN